MRFVKHPRDTLREKPSFFMCRLFFLFFASFSFFFGQIDAIVSAFSLVLGLPFLLLPSWVGRFALPSRARGWLSFAVIARPRGEMAARPRKKERTKAAPPRGEPHLRMLVFVVALASWGQVWPFILCLGLPWFSGSFLVFGCHCFSFSWGRVDLPAWRWCWRRQYSFSSSATDRHPTEERGGK